MSYDDEYLAEYEREQAYRDELRAQRETEAKMIKGKEKKRGEGTDQ